MLKLIKEKPMSGYELIKKMSEMTENTFIPSKGVIYPFLDDMRKNGYLRVKSRGKRGKVVYEVSKKAEEIINSFSLSSDFLKKYEKVILLHFSLFKTPEEREVMEKCFRMAYLSTGLVKEKKEAVLNLLNKCLKSLEGVDNK